MEEVLLENESKAFLENKRDLARWIDGFDTIIRLKIML